MKKASGGLTAICIIAILLGALGILGAAGGLLGAVLGEQLQEAFTPPATANTPMAKQQEQMQQEMEAVADKWAPVNYSLFAVLIVVAGCLIFGGVQAMRLQPNGRQFLMVAFLMAIVFELVRLIPTVSIQLATMDIMEGYMADMLKGAPGSPPPPPAAQRMVGMSMKVGMFIGFAFTGIWLLLKLGFYGFGTMYLRRPQTLALFEPATELDWSDDEPEESDLAE